MLNLFKKMYKNNSTEFEKMLEKKLINSEKMFIVTANPETFMISRDNDNFKKLLYDSETTIVPDGIGVVKAAHMLGFDIKERITGIDIANKLLSFGNKYNKTIYLFGAKEEVLFKMKSVLNSKYPNLTIIGSSNGYVKDRDKIFKNILSMEPDIVLVALGIPDQEKIIYKYLSKFSKGIFVGVGGSFDVISGKKKRAPKFFIKTNTEWLYRIIKEPKRLKRFYESNIKFLFTIRNLRRRKKHEDLSNNTFI